jgi:hypothetical protein
MDDAGGMCTGERSRYVDRNLGGTTGSQPGRVRERVADGPPLNELHDDERGAAVGAVVEERDDVRVDEAGYGPGLSLETSDE